MDVNQVLKSEENMTKVSLSKLQSNHVTVLDGEKSIETFRHVLTSAVKEKGIANVASAQFSAKVTYADDQTETYYFWLGKKGEKSSFMHSENTSIIYTISEEQSEELLDLMKRVNKS